MVKSRMKMPTLILSPHKDKKFNIIWKIGKNNRIISQKMVTLGERMPMKRMNINKMIMLYRIYMEEEIMSVIDTMLRRIVMNMEKNLIHLAMNSK